MPYRVSILESSAHRRGRSCGRHRRYRPPRPGPVEEEAPPRPQGFDGEGARGTRPFSAAFGAVVNSRAPRGRDRGRHCSEEPEDAPGRGDCARYGGWPARGWPSGPSRGTPPGFTMAAISQSYRTVTPMEGWWGEAKKGGERGVHVRKALEPTGTDRHVLLDLATLLPPLSSGLQTGTRQHIKCSHVRKNPAPGQSGLTREP